MALQPATVWEIQTGGSNSLNGGGFDAGNASMDANGTALFATTSAPCFNSANATAELADVGYHVFVKSGTNWTPGWYPITSIGLFSANIQAGGTGYSVNDILTLVGGTFSTAAQVKVTAVAAGVVTAVSTQVAGAYTVLPGTPVATSYGGSGIGFQVSPQWGWILNAAIGSVVLANYVGNSTTYLANTVAGCATTSSPTAASWSCDFSQNATARYPFTDMVIGATTTMFTSVANPVSKKMIGNTINVASGTGFTVQFVSILSTVTTTATCDKSLGTAASTGGTGGEGGCLATFLQADTLAVAGNDIHWKKGTYTITVAIALAVSGDDTSGPIRVIGYDTIRGDNTGTRPLLTTSTTTINLINLNAKNRRQFINIKLSHTGATRGAGFIGLAGIPNYIRIENCLIDGCSNGLQCGNIGSESASNYFVVDNTEVKNCTNDGIQLGGVQCLVNECYVHGNTRDGFRCGGGLSGGITLTCNVFAVNGGRGIYLPTNGTLAMCCMKSNTVAGNTLDGFASVITSANALALILENNIFYANGTSGTVYGATLTNSATQVLSNRNNAYGANFTGPRNNLAVGKNDVTIASDPFTNSAGGDYSLKSTGGGATCRAAGSPGTFAGGTSIGYRDIGAIQHQDPAGGGGGMMLPAAQQGGYAA